MAAFINTNLASLNAQRNLSASQSGLATSLQRLSSGMRINSSKDDAAGLAIADRMSSQIRGNNVAIRNANDGISLAQTAEGAIGKMGESLQRMRELAVQARNTTNGTDDKAALDTEFQALASEVTRVATGTNFNGKKVLGADAGTAFDFQVGAGTSTEDTISITTKNLTTDTTITDATGSAVTGNTAAIGITIDKIDAALKTINSERATYGATQNRFESVVSNLQTSVEATSASRSRIMDTDFAAETASLTRGQILQQAGTAMLAQANSLPNGVLALLRG